MELRENDNSIYFIGKEILIKSAKDFPPPAPCTENSIPEVKVNSGKQASTSGNADLVQVTLTSEAGDAETRNPP